jgi:hypothetical protein
VNWTCPFCSYPQTVTKPNYWNFHTHISIAKHALGEIGVRSTAYVCANADCNQITLDVSLVKNTSRTIGGVLHWNDTEDDIKSIRLIPFGIAKPQAEYIPKAIREDYVEACLIVDMSPKASATLARRCLQGMIRDFCRISKKRLIDEITELEKQVREGTADRNISVESVTAIDAIRRVGNIGAHMEADVDHIVSVEPGEAKLLLELLETLFADWYVERHSRHERFAAITALGKAKDKLVAENKQVAAPTLPNAESPG